jgi:hypothetical protein
MSDTLLRGFPEIEWENCYPTDESLDAFRAVPTISFDRDEAAATLRRELSRCAENCCAFYEEREAVDILDRPCIHGHFSTGGWSGAEEILGVLLGKFWIRNLQYQWNRGGHYIFEFPSEAEGP